MVVVKGHRRAFTIHALMLKLPLVTWKRAIVLRYWSMPVGLHLTSCPCTRSAARANRAGYTIGFRLDHSGTPLLEHVPSVLPLLMGRVARPPVEPYPVKSITDYPATLYKYLPRKYAGDFIRQGLALFRNLTSFKQMEHLARGDVRGGCHVDSPSNDVVITRQQPTLLQITGSFSMRTAIQAPDKLFILCLSEVHDEKLYGDLHVILVW